ncbi:apolipoprotein L3-like [Centropristis striata]|uniref:apolipoprotein L3-like n=1 Tax=Centropristis striata TaxID=184440 RepID=UPI0027DFD631|nr:apolipoprotein L3-like [Centropristis striata]
MSQDDTFDDVEEMTSYSLQSTSKAAFMYDDEDQFGKEDFKPKKPSKIKPPQKSRRSSKEDMLDNTKSQKKNSSFSADELYDDDCLESCKSDSFAEDDFTQTGKGFMSPEEMYDTEDDLETCKPQKKTSKLKGLKKFKAKKEPMPPEFEDPPGAASGDFLSEAAKAEWLAAQMDGRAMDDMEDGDVDDGDTDSLMEWWNTVEQWDEVPSDDEEKVLKEDESKSFTILADKVERGLRVFNKTFTERAEVLWQSIITLHAIADDISNFHHKAKIAGITGGTTTAVGGVAAIAGLALAPLTLGVSLVITAVGVGVATAGGITSASAAISDNVNNMHDRKKVETVLLDYEGHLLAIRKILHFLNQGLYRLRGHPFLRSGTQHYSENWEIRRAVQMISLVDTPVMRGTEVTDEAIAMLQGLFQGMDKYFIKESRELKKGCRKEVVSQIKEVANVLNNGIVELNAIREELQDATGNV